MVKEKAGLVFLSWLTEAMATMGTDEVRKAMLEIDDQMPNPGEEIIGTMSVELSTLWALMDFEQKKAEKLLKDHEIKALEDHIKKLRSGEVQRDGAVVDIRASVPPETVLLVRRCDVLKEIFWMEVKSRFGDRVIDGNIGVRREGRIVTWPDLLSLAGIRDALARAAAGR